MVYELVCSSDSLHNFVNDGDCTSVRRLIKSGVNPNVCNENGDSLLSVPVVNGDTSMLEVLLSSEKCEVDMTNEDSRTALMIAVSLGDLQMTKHLIKAGANVNYCDDTGKTSLLLALEEGRFEIAEYLIKHGSDVNSVDDFGQTSLYFVLNGDRDDCAKIIRILLNCGYKIRENIDMVTREELMVWQTEKKTSITKVLKKLSMKMKGISGSKHRTAI